MKEKQDLKGKLAKPEKGTVPALKVRGFKDLRLVGTLLQALPEVGTARDRVGNRQLFYDQSAPLLLLYFFTPTGTSLRGLQQVSGLSKVQQQWGVPQVGLSTWREAATVFDAERLQEVINELALRAWQQQPVPG